ncbi:hypothetical protein GCM10009430_48620 [Aquimarina litoralis]|uniref:CAAX prenyl protease 2/Lysostaphin resistance protein A-like domain-containing protein n=1 Tax=Aquimarina litoralis TaxID=584605 RepID=A0ABN1JAL1_9FLAO
MKKILNEVIGVLKTGHATRDKHSVKEYLWSFVKIFILVCVIRIIAMMFAGMVLHFLGIDIPENVTQTNLAEKSFLGRVLLVVILAPIIEELATRLGLVFNIRNFVISTSLLLFYLLHYAFNKVIILDSVGGLSLTQRTIISVLYAVVMYILLIKNDRITTVLSNFWETHKRFIFYISFLFFGYMHMFNYELTVQNIMISPIMLSSHLIMGIFLGYARLKLGLISSIGLHALNNSISYIKYLF